MYSEYLYQTGGNGIESYVYGIIIFIVSMGVFLAIAMAAGWIKLK
jgi:hypothetical protein